MVDFRSLRYRRNEAGVAPTEHIEESDVDFSSESMTELAHQKTNVAPQIHLDDTNGHRMNYNAGLNTQTSKGMWDMDVQ